MSSDDSDFAKRVCQKINDELAQNWEAAESDRLDRAEPEATDFAANAELRIARAILDHKISERLAEEERRQQRQQDHF
jgi:hypothetical protein